MTDDKVKDETFTPGSNAWWTVRRVANGDARRPWYELLREDIDALQAERDKLEQAWFQAEGKHSDEQHRADTLEAKLTALVEALRTIARSDLGEKYNLRRGDGWVRLADFCEQALTHHSAPPTTPTSAPVEDVGGGSPSLGWSAAMRLTAAEARRYARCYQEATDGRNTFLMFAEWAEKQAAALSPALIQPQGEERSDPLDLAAADDNHPQAEVSWRRFLASDKDWLADHGRKMGSGVGQQAIERLLVALDHVAADDNHKALVEALECVLADISDYECANNLAPNPGRLDCWDSVTAAKAALAAFQSRQEESR